MIKHVDITLSGKFKGTGFRFAILDEAVFLGLKGGVGYSDAGINVQAEGEEDPLKRLLKFCKDGIKGARVEKMEYAVGELKNYEEFKFNE